MSSRVQNANGHPANPEGRYVLYWMTSARRIGWNFGLERALGLARKYQRPVVVLEALRCDYPWASDRLHRFVLQGMADQKAGFVGSGVFYYPYVEPSPGAGKGLLQALARDAVTVVSDVFPTFFLSRMTRAAAQKISVRMEAVDSNGLLPLSATETAHHRAYDFRRFLQKRLPEFLAKRPKENPLADTPLPRDPEVPSQILSRWPSASDEELAATPETLARLPIDHRVGPAPLTGGSTPGTERLNTFLESVLPSYGERRSRPEDDASSGLSPWLHFGHVGAWQVLDGIARVHDWSPLSVQTGGSGSKSGWWGLPESTEAFLDECVTWRELGYHFSHHVPEHDRFESLPGWAQSTLHAHGQDERPHRYDLGALDRSETHDELWNAAQTQLAREGQMHNYLRMLWGKKILEWSPSPEQAAATMIELNNRYALDGRDPNSYSGIFWCLGRFDRPWFPERPIFGTIRYMSSDNTRRKFPVKEYIARYARLG